MDNETIFTLVCLMLVVQTGKRERERGKQSGINDRECLPQYGDTIEDYFHLEKLKIIDRLLHCAYRMDKIIDIIYKTV